MAYRCLLATDGNPISLQILGSVAVSRGQLLRVPRPINARGLQLLGLLEVGFAVQSIQPAGNLEMFQWT